MIYGDLILVMQLWLIITRKKTLKISFYANKMYEIARKINNPDDQLEALQKSSFLENPIKSKELFKKYDLLKDSKIERNKAKKSVCLNTL